MIEFSDVQTFFIVLVAVLGFVITVDKVVDIIKKAKKPGADVVNKLSIHDEMLMHDHDRIKKQEEATKLLVRGVSLLMSHEIDGNHVELLKEASDDMNKFLIDRM